ncbi:MAG: DNA mismatch repair protein MutS [Erysipelotrichaceae bacterium]
MKDVNQYTPMIQQYLEVKNQNSDSIVFYRLGDFYEMFFEDALVASRELDLVLTARNGGSEQKVPMCGIPFHAVNNYLPKLVARGYKVAIVEQLEEAGATKGIVKRDVVKIVTPGTLIDDQRDEKASVYLSALYEGVQGYTLLLCEMSTGELRCHFFGQNLMDVRKQLLLSNTREVVVQSNASTYISRMLKELPDLVVSLQEDTHLEAQYAPLLQEEENLDLRQVLALLTNYLSNTQKRFMSHLLPIEIVRESDYVRMDYPTRTNLELIEPLRANAKSLTLWSFLDRCLSAMGSRRLKRWVSYPLIEPNKIAQRLDTIEYINDNFLRKAELKSSLKEVYDLERLGARIAYGSINPKELQRLIRTLQQAPHILHVFEQCTSYQALYKVDACQDLCAYLDRALSEEPPLNVKDGNVFREGFHEELDALRQLSQAGEQWIVELENQQKEATGIKSLKVGYNRVFGYYIEVSKANLNLVKPEYGYVRKQTLTNCERFITDELKAKEEQILHAQERLIRLECELFDQLVEHIKTYLEKIHQLADALATIDALYALAEVSSENGYVRPSFNEHYQVNIEKGRHPILEKTMKNQAFVANDFILDEQQKMFLLTGPNMGGKSTYMRQIALMVIMAQIGCYVPAKKADLMIFTQIFTRIGASDDIMSGKSTFMVEMSEANNALQHADEQSLILFDEIGRGTSTYDGMALAGAMIEYIDHFIHAKTIFSTHYHELTSLENETSIRNIHVEVHEENDHVTFLYRVQPGKADKSYGINVARLAKLPDALLERAQQILNNLENEVEPYAPQSVQYIVKTSENEWVIEQLKSKDFNSMTPLEALNYLSSLKQQLR